MTVINPSDRISGLEKDFGKLSRIQKVLLFTDGSITASLDVLYGKTKISVLSQKTVKSDARIAELLNIKECEEVNFRTVIIHKENMPLIYAESYAPQERLNEDFKKELMASEAGIGRIIKTQNVETRREILSVNTERCENESFKSGQKLLLSRTYRIISGGKSLVWIKEIFSPNIR
ncbi:MAG: chorismate lyase [Endomicrobium sp.]|nr:chorismate lyase [Endomicrobium sp.]